ncbi:hypothetical protein ACOME3_000515 [Neoechinorhynchus agilis]
MNNKDLSTYIPGTNNYFPVDAAAIFNSCLVKSVEDGSKLDNQDTFQGPKTNCFGNVSPESGYRSLRESICDETMGSKFGAIGTPVIRNKSLGYLAQTDSIHLDLLRDR